MTMLAGKRLVGECYQTIHHLEGHHWTIRDSENTEGG